jgi:hypothetical protein
MPTQSQLKQIRTEIKNKGYATDCPPDNFNFFSHQNVRDFINLLNNDPNNEMYPEDFHGPYYDSIEINEPWGNCVAIYLTGSNNEANASKALNKHADNFVKNNPDTNRDW